MIVAITGTRKGIGRTLAEHFLGDGHTVFGCSRKESTLEHANYFHHLLDVAEESAVKTFFRTIRARCGKLDVLINNAAEASMNHVLLTPKATLTRLYETNLAGTFVCSQEAAKLLKKSESGRIINFSSVAVPMRLEGAAAYSATKSAVVNLTEIMSKELGSYGITVNAIGPTPVLTSMTRTVPKELIDRLIDRQTIKRMGTMEDLINVVDFLVRPASSFITGQTIYLGGIVP